MLTFRSRVIRPMLGKEASFLCHTQSMRDETKNHQTQKPVVQDSRYQFRIMEQKKGGMKSIFQCG